MSSIRGVALCSLLVVATSGCGKSEPAQRSSAVAESAQAATKGEPSPTQPQPAPSAAPPPSAAPAPAQKVELEIGAVANTMLYDKKTLTVPAGAEVHLVLKDAKPGTLMHNWVLVKPGTEATVAAAGLPAGTAGNYVIPGPDVIAFAPLAQPGKTSEVTFQAPPAGSYPYICTFPGHYLLMKGTFIVTP
jgi:azurin